MATYDPASFDIPRADEGSAEAARRELGAVAARYARARRDRWEPVHFEIDAALAADVTLAGVAYGARIGMVHEVCRRLDPLLPEPLLPCYLDALLRVPRERFVLPEDIASSADDTPLPLDREGLATVSAPHAYLLTYALLKLNEGDHLLELGTGTGYGVALGGQIVGPAGRIESIEIDPDLAARARRLTNLLANGRSGRIALYQGDASSISLGLLSSFPRTTQPLKVAVTFALHAVPSALLAALPEGARLVAPVTWPSHAANSQAGEAQDSPPPAEERRADEHPQELLLWEKRCDSIHRSAHGAVRYVMERH